MEETTMKINLLELHCTGINYPKRISFFSIPYLETDHELNKNTDEISMQEEHYNPQDREVEETFINNKCPKKYQEPNVNIEEITRQKYDDLLQKSNISESTLNLSEWNYSSKNHPNVKQTHDNESYNEVQGTLNIEHYQERKIGESCFNILNGNSDNKYNTGINLEHPQEKHIGESFIYIAYSKNNNELKEKAVMTNNEILFDHCQYKKFPDNTITSFYEDIYSTVRDSIENSKENAFSTGDDKIHSLLDKKDDKSYNIKDKYPSIPSYNAHLMEVNNSASINTSIESLEHIQERKLNLLEFSDLSFDHTNDSTKQMNLSHSQESHDLGLYLNLSCGNEITADHNESDYTEPYGNMYNDTGADIPLASIDDNIYCTISDLSNNSKDQKYSTEDEIPGADWIHDTLAMLDSVANFDHIEAVDNDASAEFEDKSYSDAPTLRISDINPGSNQLSASCYDLNHTLDESINQLSISTCDVRPPPLPPKNKFTNYDKSSNEFSVSHQKSNLCLFGTLDSNQIIQNKQHHIGSPTYQIPLENDGKASGVEKMGEPMDQRLWENPIHNSPNCCYTPLSSIDEEILQAPVPYGPPPPKPPRLEDMVSCLVQSNDPALKNSLRMSKSLSHLPNDNNSQNTRPVTATKSVLGGGLPLFPSERQRDVEPYQSPYVSSKDESFFAKIKKHKITSTRKISRSGEDLAIGHPYKIQHLNTGIDYLKNLEKEKYRDSLDYLSNDDEKESIHEEKSFKISKTDGISSDEEKIYNLFKYTDDMKNKNLEIYMDDCKTLMNENEISNGKSRIGSNKNLSDDAKHEKSKHS